MHSKTAACAPVVSDGRERVSATVTYTGSDCGGLGWVQERAFQPVLREAGPWAAH